MAAKKSAPKPAPAKAAAAKAGKKPAPKAAPAKSAPKEVTTTSAKAGTANGALKPAKTVLAPKATKKAKSAPVAQKGPIALRTPSKRKPAAPPPTSPTTSTEHAPTTVTSIDESGTYYIVVEHEDLRISTTRPTSTGRVETAANFDEAKDKAVDRLIDLIDRFERRLWEVKQSLDHDTLVDRD